MAFYQRLRDLREDSDLTQKQASEIIGVSMNHYGKYERGETEIPFDKALILAKYYNVSLDYIAGRTNEKTAFTDFSNAPKKTVMLLRQLNNVNRERIEERMLEMIEQQNKK